MDLELKKIKNLKWLPFVGSNYFKLPHENRVLIVGESHYLDGTEEAIIKHNNPLFTRIVINELAIERNYWSTKIFQNLHKVLFNNDDFDAGKFWNLVSYYNFIQRPMNSNKDRPSSKEFHENWSTFFELVKVLKPRVCLFIGNTSANYISKAISNSEFYCEGVKWEEHINGAYAKKAIIKSSNNKEIKIIFIKHTSQRFTLNKWNEYLTKTIGEELKWFQKSIIKI